MKRRFAYDQDWDPPAPVVPVRVSPPVGTRGAMLPGLIDTGADCTLAPSAVVRALGLPLVDRVALLGIAGRAMRVDVHAARLQLGGHGLIARVVAFGDGLVIGRDLLNLGVIHLDGPRLTLTATWR